MHLRTGIISGKFHVNKNELTWNVVSDPGVSPDCTQRAEETNQSGLAASDISNVLDVSLVAADPH